MANQTDFRLNLTSPFVCNWNLTGRCNLQCLHCSAGAKPERTGDLPIAQLFRIADQLINRAKIFYLYFSGGEPFLRADDFFALAAKFRNNGVAVRAFTNATLITDDIARRLAQETPMRVINTSLDGASAETHDHLRGKGAFERTVQGMGRLLRVGIRSHMNCIVSRINLRELHRIAALAGELGGTISFGIAAIVGRAREHADLLVLTKAEMDDVYDTVTALSQEFKHVNGGALLEWAKGHAEQSLSIRTQAKPGQRLAPCGICKESLTITPDGWVVPCNNWWEYRIGNVLSQDILDIYFSEKANRIRELSRLTSDGLEGCADCLYTGLCCGGCRAVAYAETGSLTGIDHFRCLKYYHGLRPQDPVVAAEKVA
jgi:radical SAM protein with 4Fe4S-binding SPASM domain